MPCNPRCRQCGGPVFALFHTVECARCEGGVHYGWMVYRGSFLSAVGAATIVYATREDALRQVDGPRGLVLPCAATTPFRWVIDEAGVRCSASVHSLHMTREQAAKAERDGAPPIWIDNVIVDEERR